MNNSPGDRKALLRRLHAYAAHQYARHMMLSYLFNRLKNEQLRDVLALLDTDPECRPPARGRRKCRAGSSCTDPRCEIHGNWPDW